MIDAPKQRHRPPAGPEGEPTCPEGRPPSPAAGCPPSFRPATSSTDSRAAAAFARTPCSASAACIRPGPGPGRPRLTRSPGPTRPADVRGRRPSCATVAEIAGLARDAEDEAALARVEGAAAQWDVAFLRRDEAGRPSIVLSRRVDGPLPALTTAWALSFDAAEQRDRFYAWLCARLDRWEAWAELAGELGATKLTNRLVAMLAE